MSYQGMQSFKAENQRKTALLLILFPAFLFIIFWVILTWFFTDTYSRDDGLNMTLGIFPIVLIVLGIRGLISFFLQKNIMFGLSGAKAITRKENSEIYNIVENLCISRGLPMPNIAIMDEAGMNAFATGWRKKDSWIAFTSGLLQKLDKREIEAVAGHELTHLTNKDSLLMYVAYVFIGAMTLIGQYLLRGTYRLSSKKSTGIAVFGIAFLFLGYLLYPLVRLAISRKREYLADLGSVELTRDNESMISALKKISSNSYVSKACETIGSFFIAEPRRPSDISWSKNLDTKIDNFTTTKKIKTSIRDSHPSIDDRIAKLQGY